MAVDLRARTIRTARLDLHATSLVHLDAELESPHALGEVLVARVPASWPPGELDADAIRFFRERLVEAGPESAGWFGWYGVMRGSEGVDDVLVGSAGYFGPPTEDGTVEIGYSVAPEWRGRGIASEMIAALVERAFADPRVARVIAHTADDNEPSQGALTRAGFTLVGMDEGRQRWERERG